MDSCFPPLGALSLRDSKKSLNLGKEARRSMTGPSKVAASEDGESNHDGKIEILQDLDLYYIRQIAHNLKVRLQCTMMLGLIFFLRSLAPGSIRSTYLEPSISIFKKKNQTFSLTLRLFDFVVTKQNGSF